MLWVERTFKDHLIQPLCNVQGHLQLKQVAQSYIQPYLECIQGLDICHLSRQPVPVFQHLHCKKFLPYMYTVSTPFYLKTLAPCPSAIDPTKNLSPCYF